MTPRLLHRRAVGRRQMLELVLDRVVGLDDLLAAAGAAHHIGQPVIGLRADHQVDDGRAPQDLLAFGLRDAAGDADRHFAAGALARRLQLADAAELGIDLFGRLLADVAGVEQHQVGLVDRVGRDIAARGQRIAHALRVVDVHLAAIGLDEDLSRRRNACGGGFAGLHAPALRGFDKVHARASSPLSVTKNSRFQDALAGRRVSRSAVATILRTTVFHLPRHRLAVALRR